jgi:DnaJ family protein C protein 9
MSLKVHPDKVEESLREECKLKFQALGKIYTILSDAGKKCLYDESGDVDGDNVFDENLDWRVLFKKITEEDIHDFFKNYKDSNEEKEDLKRYYVKHKGDMDLIHQEMISSSFLEDEERFREIIKKAIDDGDVEKFRKFTHETKAKKEQRRAKYEKEAKEAEKLGFDGDIAKAIANNQESRKKTINTFFDNLEEKYGKKDKIKNVYAGKVTKTRSTKRLKKSEDDE